jgi:hypothetical protein
MQREFTILKALETRRDYYDGDGNRHVAVTTTSSNCEARHPSEPSRRGGLEHRVPLLLSSAEPSGETEGT